MRILLALQTQPVCVGFEFSLLISSMAVPTNWGVKGFIPCRKSSEDVKMPFPPKLSTNPANRSTWYTSSQHLTTGTMVLVCLTGLFVAPALAINIEIEYSTDFGGDEAPSWDPNGDILKAHFAAGVEIWERLLPGDGDFEFDFQWDDDISGLGLATDIGFIDQFIEINPNANWYADPTPLDNSEFNMPTQLFAGGLSGPQQATFFPGTAPPATLEVGYRLAALSGFPSDTGQPGVTAANGNDLLSTILHEIGHMLGIGADPIGEPGQFNIDPQHVGGLSNVLVLEDNDSGHLGGDGMPPVLVCEGCEAANVRRFPTATDVLVIAEDQGISDVRLDRVASIDSGIWSSTNRWIGGAVPNANQDVMINHGGTITLDIGGNVRDLLVAAGNTLTVGSNRIDVDGTLNMAGATVSLAGGGTLAAHNLVVGTVGNGTLTTAPGSTVRFNNYTQASAGPVAFAGNVGIGYDQPGLSALTYSPGFSEDWIIAGTLSIGDENTDTKLVIDQQATFNSTTGIIGTDFNGGGKGRVEIRGDGASWVVAATLLARNGLLEVFDRGHLETGHVTIGSDEGEMHAGVDGIGSTWNVMGNVDIGPPTTVGNGLGGLTVQDQGLVDVSGHLNVHGTSSGISYVLVKTDGTLDVAGDITVGPWANAALTGSTIRTSQLLLDGGTFTWTGGTLDLTEQEVVLDSSLAPRPLPANTSLQNSQELILSGAGRDLTVGNSASGQLDMQNLAAVRVEEGDVFVAKNVGSSGGVDLQHQGTSMFVGGSMAVGGDHTNAGGAGQLSVNGELTVAGTLTYWPIATVNVGTTGTISADVLQQNGGGGGNFNSDGTTRFNQLAGFGATMSLGRISAIGIGEGNAGQGTLVRSAGQDYVFQQGWIIGDNAPARVDLVDGGEALGDGYVHLGNRVGSGGTVLNVSGDDGLGSPSELFMTGEFDGELIVGLQAKAFMNVTDGGHVFSPDAIVAHDFTAEGSVANVAGGGSYWEVHGNLTVGGGAEGAVNITEKGLVEIDHSLYIGGAPIEEIKPGDGGSAPSVVRISGPLSTGIAHQNTVVGYNLAGQLVVDDQAQMLTDLSALIAAESSAEGSLAKIASSATWQIGQDLTVGDQAQGGLDIGSLGMVTVGSNAYLGAGGPTGKGLITLSDKASLDILGNLYIGGNALASVGLGTVSMQDDALVKANRIVNWESGELQLGGVVDVGLNQVENHGVVSGAGEIRGDLLNFDTVSPGAGADLGVVTVTGDFTQTTEAKIIMELAATDHDKLELLGNAAFHGGTLHVDLLGDFQPSVGDQFKIFGFGSTVSGIGLAAFEFPLLNPGHEWNKDDFYTLGIIQVDASLPGDFDFDGDVDGNDFLTWQKGESYTPMSDTDLADWKTNLGMSLPSPLVAANTVPEPSTLLGLMLGLVTYFTRAR